MTGLFDNASFGTCCQTRDGGKAIYIAHLMHNDTHKILVQGFDMPFIYTPDGKRKGGGKYVSRYGTDLDITKIID